ncbi:hypothetical protein MASR1M32_25730 [Rhodobacter sp.]
MDRQEADPVPDTSLRPPERKAFGAEPCHDARVLTAGGTSARIVLGDQVYALRITRAGKLILAK